MDPAPPPRPRTPPWWYFFFWVGLGGYAVSLFMPAGEAGSPAPVGWHLLVSGLFGLILTVFGPFYFLLFRATGKEFCDWLMIVLAVVPWLANFFFFAALTWFGGENWRAALKTSLVAVVLAATLLVCPWWGRAYPNLTLPLPAYAYWVGSMVWMALGSAFMASYYKSTRLAEVEEHLQEGAGERWQGASPPEPGTSEKIQEKSG